MEATSNNTQPQRENAQANVRYGVFNQPSNVAGKTVQEIRSQFSKMWGIPSDAVAYCGKDKLDENSVIQPGQNIEFHRRAGEKG